MKFLTVITVLFMSQGLFADGHGHSEPSFEGLISSEIFDLDGKMDMHVERRESCGGDTPKHFIQPPEHWFMFSMESLNRNLQANGRGIQKMSIGLKGQTGFMAEMMTHRL